MKFILVCVAGMSSSLVVNDIKKKQKQIGYTEIYIKAIPIEEFDEEVIDSIGVLLAPQIKYRLKECRSKIGELKLNINIDIIDTMDYGLCRGENILLQVKSLLGSALTD